MVSVKDITLCVDVYAASMPSTSREEHGTAIHISTFGNL